MSGVGEAIAIVSCIAGLIQALDSSSRIVRQIKQRRQAHRANGALPPSDALEKTIEDGKTSIQQFVAKGNERFGPEFERGDATAQLAIMRVTIQIQNALLQRLTEARADDGVTDFAECIDLSDQGCNDALIVLRELYKRKLEEITPRREENPSYQQEPEQGKRISRVHTEPTATVDGPNVHPISSKPDSLPVENAEPFTPPPSVRRKSRGFPRLFHSKSGDDYSNELPPWSTYHRAQTAPADIPKPQRSSTVSFDASFPSPQQKRSSRYSTSSQNSSNPDHFEPKGRGTEPASWTQGMSRASTLATMASTATTTTTPSTEIAKYGGCCKYAYLIRDKGPKGNLEARNTAFYGENWVLQCRSQKCQFGKQAVNAKKREQVDTSVYNSHGVQFRWLFLAKSHCAQEKVSENWPYVCLICQLLNHDPQRYHGAEDLFAHIATHKEEAIGDIPLAGPLTFDNRGIKRDPQFDLNLPEREVQADTAGYGKDIRVADDLQKRIEKSNVDRDSKTSSMESYQSDEASLSVQTDPYENPWRD